MTMAIPAFGYWAWRNDSSRSGYGLISPRPAVDDEPIATILARPLVRLCAKRVRPCSNGIGSTGICEGSLSMDHQV